MTSTLNLFYPLAKKCLISPSPSFHPLAKQCLISASPRFYDLAHNLYQTSPEPKTKTALVPRYSSSLARSVDTLFPSAFMRDMNFDMSPLMKRMDDQMNNFMMMQKSSPGYKINEDENKVELIVEVPGVSKENIDLDVRGEGKVLHISGKRMVKEGGSEIESKFEKSFMLGELFDSNKITATLDNGVLTIIAPKLVQEEKVQKN